eukprot:SAG31_NODE_2294_length_5991_cov_2.589613_6_plen_83_part_00
MFARCLLLRVVVDLQLLFDRNCPVQLMPSLLFRGRSGKHRSTHFSTRGNGFGERDHDAELLRHFCVQLHAKESARSVSRPKR